jgi:hypothetical protein
MNRQKKCRAQPFPLFSKYNRYYPNEEEESIMRRRAVDITAATPECYGCAGKECIPFPS